MSLLLSKHFKLKTRRYHAWFAIFCVLPILLISGTGALLVLKKDFSWIQPPSERGSVKTPQITFAEILTAAKSNEGIGIKDWGDVSRLDIRPKKGIVKVRTKDMWEIQIDLGTGKVISSAIRRSDLIESIHDGTWFFDSAKYFVVLPVTACLIFLCISGTYLFYIPLMTRRSKRRKTKANQKMPERGIPVMGVG
jgi:uncharacterized iron-regulated membrane protein